MRYNDIKVNLDFEFNDKLSTHAQRLWANDLITDKAYELLCACYDYADVCVAVFDTHFDEEVRASLLTRCSKM